MDDAFVSKNFVGYGGGISGDVEPGWFGWAKDDFQCQFTVGNSLGRCLNNSPDAALATNLFGATACATPRPGCTGVMAESNILAEPIGEFGASVGYQHWWLPTSISRSNAAGRGRLIFWYAVDVNWRSSP